MKNFKDISEKRSIYYNDIIKALDLVFKFIVDNNRILYGGMAIDLALKSNNHAGIYEEDSIPDYDFYSFDFYNDSIKLADILFENKLTNISAINASHYNSRRVRTNFINVADITYVPKSVYETIPTITINSGKYTGIKIVHPNFQRMDLHRSFNIPFNNSPQEVIMHRFEKDEKRYRILDSVFPIKLDIPNPKYITVEFDKKILENTMIGGILCYMILVKLINQKTKINIPGLFEIKNNKIIVNLPEEANKINLVINEFKEAKEYYNKYLDNIKPLSGIITMEGWYLEYFYNKHEMIPCYDIEYENTKLKLAQPNYILLYFLQNYMSTNKNIWLYLYKNTCLIVEKAEELYKQNKLNFFKDPFFVTVNTFGKYHNLDSEITEYEEKHNIKLKPPFGYYPKNTYTVFDISTNPLFKMDGNKVETINFSDII